MDSIINGFSLVFNMISMVIEMIIGFFQMLLMAIPTITEFAAYMPAYIQYGVITTIGVAVIKTLLSRGGSNA